MKFVGTNRNKKGFRVGKFNPFNMGMVAFKDPEGDPNGGDGGAGGGADDTFEWKDPEGKTYKLPNKPEIKEAISKSSHWGKKDATRKFQSQLDEMSRLVQDKTTTLETLQNKMREIEEAGLSDVEKHKKQQERMKLETEAKIKALADEKAQWENRYTETEIKNTLYGALSKHGLNNPAQTMMIIKQLGKAKLVKDEQSGEYKTVLDAKSLGLPDPLTGGIIEGELSPQEAIDKFLAMPDNAHHLKNNLKPGNGTSQTGGMKKTDGTITYKRSQIANDPKVRAEYNQKLLAREKVELTND